MRIEFWGEEVKALSPMQKLPPPFPYFGGKSHIAHEVWKRFGVVKNYVEPFAGSLAVFLAAPTPPKIATLNDLDGFIVNFWRAVKYDPDGVAHYADWPITELDLFARQVWLLARKRELVEKLMADPDYYDVKIAGWWVWGQSAWIGSGWCRGDGPWTVVDGKVVKLKRGGGVHRQRPHLGDSGEGVHRPLPSRSDSSGGVHLQRPHLSATGMGVHRNFLITSTGACEAKAAQLREYMRTLADRLRFARITCGDFERVLGPHVTYEHGLTAVFLDPPYAADRADGLYTQDNRDASTRAREWCKKNGDNPLLRIAICGLEGEHNELEALGWKKLAWKGKGGYGNWSRGRGHQNARRERIWFSPHCYVAEQPLWELEPEPEPEME